MYSIIPFWTTGSFVPQRPCEPPLTVITEIREGVSAEKYHFVSLVPRDAVQCPHGRTQLLVHLHLNSIGSEKMTEKFMFTEGHRLMGWSGKSVGFEIWPIWVQIPVFLSELIPVFWMSWEWVKVPRKPILEPMRKMASTVVASCVDCHEDGFWCSRCLIQLCYFPFSLLFS